ncbi:MAG TPA: SpoIIE family protein phosphatase [Acidimicrobiia bacterium]|jgi:serine phosphatase RsbU (regulator of sigma subunit)/anti-sigma regulatory factor (Ser/Thr protein kinase)/CHASE3 domain sensor protein|nr:SpoIIE family protein phosphatase [Acidimicrobiia bacterium]
MSRRLTLLIGGYFLVIAIMVAAVLPFALGVLHSETTIEHRLDPATRNSHELLVVALDEETGERGYVLSAAHDPWFLAPYQAARARQAGIEDSLASLKLSADERDALQATIDALHKWSHDHAEHEIALVHNNQTPEARSAASTTRGRQLFDDFRNKQGQFVALIDKELAAKRRELHRSSLLAILALAAGSVLAIVLALLVRNWSRAAEVRERERARERMAFSEVHRLASVLATAHTSSDIAALAVQETASILGVSDVHIWTIGDRDRLHLAGTTDTLAQDGTAPSVLAISDHNAPADVLADNRPLFFSTRDAYASTYPGWASVLDVQGAGALAVLPARSDLRAIGAVELFYRAPREFDEDERMLLELTAEQIGNALGHAYAREREHAAAAKLQESLLGPQMLVDGVGHASRYLPAEATLHIGGDWHNVQRLADGRILIAVGDVVGRGLEAATVMGQLRSAVSAIALRCDTPAELLVALDEFAAEIPGASSTTVAVAFADIERATLDYVCAGHPPPVLVSPEGDARLLDNAVSWPLAIGPTRPSGIGARVPFPPGSLVLLYSDGLIERRREPLDEGIDRLVEAVTANWNTPLDTLCDRLLERVLQGHRRDDDIALLALRSPVVSPKLFLMKLEATPAAVGRVRERLRGWLDEFELPPDDQLAILVAVGEACTNAIEHAYGSGRPNLFRVEAQREGDAITCCVTDTGAWKDNATRTARGNGLAIMRELMDDVVVVRRNSGTSVTLTYRVGVRNETALLG